ncbi:MAG TPA: cell wall hydrolase [Novosphingobium sp.]|nr:cell wall hydrolase [Novosphingobium sp.]
MSTKLRLASGIAVAAMFLATLTSAEGSGANAQPYEGPRAPEVTFVTEPVIQPLPAPEAPVEATQDSGADAPSIDAGSLAQLISATPLPQDMSSELACLAGAIYFEAKGETLAGQLAVGRVIVARAKSGRFPSSYCGVVYQRSQFSFVRGQSMPRIDKSGRAWSEAAKIARIAHEGSWKSPVEGALFFHAARVSPNWRLTRMARVDHHVFYR